MLKYHIHELSTAYQCGKILYQGSPSGLVGKSVEGVGDETVVCVETDEKVITVLPDKKIARDRIMYIRDCVYCPICILREYKVLKIVEANKKKGMMVYYVSSKICRYVTRKICYQNSV